MPMLSGNLGTGDVRTSQQPNGSLLYRVVEVTPETVSLRAFTPFTDFSWRDMNIQMGRTLADFNAPIALWSTPKTATGNRRQMEVFSMNPKFVSVLDDGETAEEAAELIGPNLIRHLVPLMINAVDKPFDTGRGDGTPDKQDFVFPEHQEGGSLAAEDLTLETARQGLQNKFGSAAAQMGYNPTTGTPLFFFKFYPTAAQGHLHGETAMYNEIGKYSGENMNVIGVTMDEGNVTFHFTQSMIETVLIKMRDAVERMQRWTPVTVPIGMGNLRTVDGKAGVYVNDGVSDRWVSGSVAYRGKRVPSAGTIYVPDDFMPYSAKRRAAPYHNIWHTCFINWMRSACPIGDGTTIDEAISMSTLILADKVGFNTPGAVPTTAMDPESVADRARELLALPFAKSYVDFDPAAYLGIDGNGGKLRKKDGWSSADFQRKCASWWLTSISLAAASTQTAALSAPGMLLYDGGPRPDQIGEQLKLAYRPDMSTGTYSNPMGVTLVNSSIKAGVRENRFPTLIRSYDMVKSMQDAGAAGIEFSGQIKTLDDYTSVDPDASIIGESEVNTWVGIKDPLIIPEVKQVTMQDGRPETVVEEDYYFYTPKVIREGMTAATYKKRRKFVKVMAPRPDTHFALPCRRGFMISWVSDAQSVPSQGFYTTISVYSPPKRGDRERFTYTINAPTKAKQMTGAQKLQIGAGEDLDQLADTFTLTAETQTSLDVPTKLVEDVKKENETLGWAANRDFEDLATANKVSAKKVEPESTDETEEGKETVIKGD